LTTIDKLYTTDNAAGPFPVRAIRTCLLERFASLKEWRNERGGRPTIRGAYS